MSIAVSAVVKPSRLLLTLVGSICLGIVFIAGAVGSGRVGDLPTWARCMAAGGCALAAVFVFCRAVMHRKTYHVDISGAGQVRLKEYSPSNTALSRQNPRGKSGVGELVGLMPTSTLWSALLLLHLKHEDQQTSVLTIFPDSVSAESFRALSVACRWIAAHNNRPNDRLV